MTRFVVLAIIAIAFWTPSQAKMSVVDRAFLHQRLHQLNTQTRMKSVLVHATAKHQRRFIVINELIDPNDEVPGPDELDLQVAFRRPEIANQPQITDSELSDHVRFRLFLARTLALRKYNNQNLT